ncbi:sulfotransferase domain-containing protein [Tautonia sociabilis]|uniref:Sulfotransferase domain-containing protein n=1 Tax=Tautonia sociabilis TaxID=2080755 RepID=A0A432MFY5_9BACT|nr:sulfotransferase domain-containing protein [Tautonia sociabilis]RUL85261.1 hypothetical protein TsocGM_18805 [Tautonia sociabilis]
METQGLECTPARPGRLPDFVVIGSAKAATNTLRRHLSAHPKVFVRDDEPSFYTYHRARGLDWYRSIHAGAADDQLVGDISTHYSRLHWAEPTARQIAEVRPDTRIIYLMREPVSRAYSNYLQLQDVADEPVSLEGLTFEQAVELLPFIVDSSDYLAVLKAYLKHFPREQILALLTEDLNNDPEAVVGRVLRFLGLEPTPGMTLDPTLRANSRDRRVDGFLRTRLIGPVTRPRAIRALVKSLPDPVRIAAREAFYGLMKRSPIGKRLEASHQPRPMAPETRARLIERFSATFPELAELTGNDLSPWLAKYR